MIGQDEWQPAAGMALEPNAFDAATATSSNLVVTAGPGAGKTELLAQRADFVLSTGHCRYPRRILAISFKVDAAKNLKDRVRRRCPPELATRLDSYTFHGFAKRLIDIFRPVLTGPNALAPDYSVGSPAIPNRQITFDAMTPLATTILDTSPTARAALAQTYGFVFLDEFQDCTRDQYNLVRAAFHETQVQLIAVGDIKQRVMAFAGALDGVLGQFAADFAARPLILYSNYRAQPRLRLMQNAMVRVMDPQAALADAALAGEGGQVDVQPYRDSQEEARALAHQIHTWITADGVSADEIAVLVRKQIGPYTEALQTELRERGVPFRIENDLQDLAAEPVAALILDFLAVVTGDQEPEAYTRLMDVVTGSRLDDDSNERPYSELRRALDAARRNYRQTRNGRLHQLVEGFLNSLGDQVLTSLAPQYQQGPWLDEVIQKVYSRLEELYAAAGDVPQALREFAGRDTVKLMTIHKAKSLEFDKVIVLAVEEEMFWGDPDEERSVYFVAVSRARSHVCLTVCENRPTPSSKHNKWSVVRHPHTEFLSYAAPTH